MTGRSHILKGLLHELQNNRSRIYHDDDDDDDGGKDEKGICEGFAFYIEAVRQSIRTYFECSNPGDHSDKNGIRRSTTKDIGLSGFV